MKLFLKATSPSAEGHTGVNLIKSGVKYIELYSVEMRPTCGSAIALECVEQCGVRNSKHRQNNDKIITWSECSIVSMYVCVYMHNNR